MRTADQGYKDGAWGHWRGRADDAHGHFQIFRLTPQILPYINKRCDRHVVIGDTGEDLGESRMLGGRVMDLEALKKVIFSDLGAYQRMSANKVKARERAFREFRAELEEAERELHEARGEARAWERACDIAARRLIEAEGKENGDEQD